MERDDHRRLNFTSDERLNDDIYTYLNHAVRDVYQDFYTSLNIYNSYKQRLSIRDGGDSETVVQDITEKMFVAKHATLSFLIIVETIAKYMRRNYDKREEESTHDHMQVILVESIAKQLHYEVENITGSSSSDMV